MDPKSTPIIFVPGIKGSKLADVYPTDFDVRWSLEDFVVGNIFEDPLDFELVEGKYEKEDEHVFREWELINHAYGRMVKRLRKWVSPRLYTFPYDWRKSIESNARRLADMTKRILNRLEALGEDRAISFVTHSMGGLVLRSALGLRDADPLDEVSRIVFIAPPFRGSCAIPEVLVKGQKNGWLSDEKNFRKLARGFPSVYQLIPSYDGAAVDEEGTALDLFDLGNWQENVVKNTDFREDFLVNAEAFVKGEERRHGGTSEASMIPEDTLRNNAEDVLILMSVGHDTLSTIPVRTQNSRNKNWFDFGDGHESELGDGRVLLKSAAIEGITLAAYRGAKEHGLVCRDNLIVKSVSSWLQGDRLLKMKPRTARNSVDRPSRTYFEEWDGTVDSFENHVMPGD